MSNPTLAELIELAQSGADISAEVSRQCWKIEKEGLTGDEITFHPLVGRNDGIEIPPSILDPAVWGPMLMKIAQAHKIEWTATTLVILKQTANGFDKAIFGGSYKGEQEFCVAAGLAYLKIKEG